MNKKGFNTEFEELFTPKYDARILNPQKNPRIFWNFFQIFRIYLWVYEDFLSEQPLER